MTTYRSPIVAGVFKDEIQARKAVDMLRNAQFERDQLGVAMRDGGTATESLSNDFMNLGVPHDQANFYEHEFQAGKIVVSVRPDGRDEEARNILASNGAYDYDAAASASQVVTEQPEATQQSVEPPAPEDLQAPSEEDTFQEPSDLRTSGTQAQATDAENQVGEPEAGLSARRQAEEALPHADDPDALSSPDTSSERDNA